MKIVKIVLSLLIMGGLTACGTLFGDNVRTVAVNSNPPGAEVYLNNLRVGKTPLNVATTGTYSSDIITVKKKGYSDLSNSVQHTFQPVAILDILALPAIIVDGVTGNFMKISPESRNMQFDLTKQDV